MLKVEFQCPISGNRHFYVRHAERKLYVKHCFNALSRAIAISTDCINNAEGAAYAVSMPYLGQSPFLQYNLFYDDADEEGFNALSRAIAISTKGRA